MCGKCDIVRWIEYSALRRKLPSGNVYQWRGRGNAKIVVFVGAVG